MNSIKKSELHLFIIWHNARKYELKIVEDIAAKFSIIKKYEIHWSKEHFSKNLSRFYGTNLPKNSHKEKHCGIGPFLAIVVEDNEPAYQEHITSKGGKLVNTKMFTSKTMHREWSGGGHRIHGSNDVAEANHNLTLLFGKNSNDFATENKNCTKPYFEKYNKNLVGHNGWKSLNQLFYVLNSTIQYVVLRNFDYLPENYRSDDHGDIDLLTTNYHEMCFITNSNKIFRSKNRVHNEIIVAGEHLKFDFRTVGDRYYDEKWEIDILENRQMHINGFFIPEQNDLYHSLLYHALIHKPSICDDYKNKLSKMSKETGNELNVEDFETDKPLAMLIAYLQRQSYSLTQPQDKSVYVNIRNINKCKKGNVKYQKVSMPPIRNHFKYAKSKSKHYITKFKRITSSAIKKFAK